MTSLQVFSPDDNPICAELNLTWRVRIIFNSHDAPEKEKEKKKSQNVPKESV